MGPFSIVLQKCGARPQNSSYKLLLLDSGPYDSHCAKEQFAWLNGVQMWAPHWPDWWSKKISGRQPTISPYQSWLGVSRWPWTCRVPGHSVTPNTSEKVRRWRAQNRWRWHYPPCRAGWGSGNTRAAEPKPSPEGRLERWLASWHGTEDSKISMIKEATIPSSHTGERHSGGPGIGQPSLSGEEEVQPGVVLKRLWERDQ